MKKYKGKIVLILMLILSIITIGINTYAHSGRTDASGGHKDNKNKSGLGSYHYHCGGHPAHLHTNGVCPYSSTKKSTSSSSSKTKTTTKSTTQTTVQNTTKAPTNVPVTEININENIQNIEIGKSKTLTATITPSNATDKSITWKSSDESIATVTSNGEIIAKNSGTVSITAYTSNGKTSTVKINVKEEPKQENNTATKTTSAISNSTTTNSTNTISDTKNNSNPVGTVLALGILGGGGYLGYKKYSKSK